MAQWERVRIDLDAAKNAEDFDRRRRAYLKRYEASQGRPLVVYAVDTVGRKKVADVGGDISVSLSDKDGWVEVTDNIPDGPLDIMIHSPGGSPYAAEWLINFLRRRFGPIRAIVPHTAKSAATMIALGCDQVVIDERGELGPIDPQISINGGRFSPCQAILDQFVEAQAALAADPKLLPAWMPILQQFAPALMIECANNIQLAKTLVKAWLFQYMFNGDADGDGKAREISDWLGDHNAFKSHSRIVSVDDLIAHKVKVVDMRAPEHTALREAVWNIWSAYAVMFNRTGVYKLFESSRDGAFITTAVQALIPTSPTALQPSPVPQSRAERRHPRK